MLMLLGAWALLAAAYLLLVGQLTADEIGLALGCGLAATIWFTALGQVAWIRFRFEPAAARAAIRALAGLPLAVAETAAALVRGRAGVIVRQPFVRGRERDPADAARRAVSVLAISVAPDKFAVRLPERRDEIELHSLVEAPSETDARWPA